MAEFLLRRKLTRGDYPQRRQRILLKIKSQSASSDAE